MPPTLDHTGPRSTPSKYCDIVEDEEEHHKDDHRKTASKVLRPTASLHEVTPQNVRQLKLINQAVFPVAYDEGFYKRVALSGDLARLAYLGGTAVGGVACQLEDEDDGKILYITTLGVLPPYRRRGIGKQLVEHVLSLCEKDPATKFVSLHVQTNNEAALAFYENFGFTVAGQMANYYRRIEPPHALILRKSVNEGRTE